MFYLHLLLQLIKNGIFIFQTTHLSLTNPFIGAYFWIPIITVVFTWFYRSKRLALTYSILSTIGIMLALLYYRAFNILPTYSVADNVPFTKALTLSGLSLLRLSDLWFLVDIIAISLFWNKDTINKYFYRLSLSMTVFTVLSIGALYLGGKPINDIHNINCVAGFPGYVISYFSVKSGKIWLSQKETKEINGFFSHKQTIIPTGEFKGKNLVILQVESLENFAVQDKTITPNINKLLDHSYQFTVQEQVKQGMSSDAEFMINTGILPIKSGSVYDHYADNSYPQSLPNLFDQAGYITEGFHTNTPEIWNWKKNLVNLGYKQISDKSKFTGNSTSLGFIEDKPFLDQTADILNKGKKPFMALVVTSTSHMPFITPNKEQLANKFEDYKQAVRYTDEAIGNFIKKIPADTVIVLEGDHEGIHKYFPTEDMPENGKRLPFIIYHPSIAGKQFQIPAGQVDMMPTIASLFGLQTKQVIGKNLMQGKGTPEPNPNELQIADLIIRGNYFKAGS